MTSISFQEPHLPPKVRLRQKFFHPFDLGRPTSNELHPPLLQMITNQIKENMIQG